MFSAILSQVMKFLHSVHATPLDFVMDACDKYVRKKA